MQHLDDLRPKGRLLLGQIEELVGQQGQEGRAQMPDAGNADTAAFQVRELPKIHQSCGLSEEASLLPILPEKNMPDVRHQKHQKLSGNESFDP